MTELSGLTNACAIADYVAGARDRHLPEDVMEAARMCLVDWTAVALGGRDDEAAQAVWHTARAWNSAGKALMLPGGHAAAPVAALVNGTLAHALDFDDTHNEAATHFSAPIWAAVLAVGAEVDASEMEMLRAFTAGFEVGARLGHGYGGVLTARGFHATGVFGKLAAAAAAAVLLGLDAAQAASALGAAATQVSGFTGSFGSNSKPFHAGKSAMDGVIAAQLASNGFQASLDLLEPGASLARTLVQDGAADIPGVDFSNGWEILHNTFKPYAACMLTHASIDAGRKLAAAAQGRKIVSVNAQVNPLATQIAARTDPQTPNEAKFSVGFGVALALCGHRASASDFSRERLHDPAVRDILRRVTLTPVEALGRTAARMSIDFETGPPASADIPLALGNPGNPLRWEDMRGKFDGLTQIAEVADPAALFALLRSFGTGRRMAEFERLAGRAPAAPLLQAA